MLAPTHDPAWGDFCATCIRDGGEVKLFPTILTNGKRGKLCETCGGNEAIPEPGRGLYSAGRRMVDAIRYLGGRATAGQLRTVLHDWTDRDIRRALVRLTAAGHLRALQPRQNVHVYELADPEQRQVAA